MRKVVYSMHSYFIQLEFIFILHMSNIPYGISLHLFQWKSVTNIETTALNPLPLGSYYAEGMTIKTLRIS